MSSLPLFEDQGVIESKFNEMLQSLKVSNIKYKLCQFTFPFIECPVGCSVLITEVGKVSFVHLLNHSFNNVKAFCANKVHLRGMQQDWLNSTLYLDTYLCSPSLIIDENGLSLATCFIDDKSINKKIIHLAWSPFGNLTHPHCDRLAPLATKIEVIYHQKLWRFRMASQYPQVLEVKLV